MPPAYVPPPEHRLAGRRLARLLGRSEHQVRRLLRAGRLRGWKDESGRWWTTHDEVARFLGIVPTTDRTAAESAP